MYDLADNCCITKGVTVTFGIGRHVSHERGVWAGKLI